MTATRTGTRDAAQVAADLQVSPSTITAWCRAWHGPRRPGRWRLSAGDELVARAWLAITGGRPNNRPVVAELRRLAEDAVRRHPRRWLLLVARDRYAATFDRHDEAVAAALARAGAGPWLIDLGRPASHPTEVGRR
jgi:hypothetical protein